MKKIIFILLALMYHAYSTAKEEVRPNETLLKGGHPYLILTPERETSVRQAIRQDDSWKQYHLLMIEEANALLSQPVCQRKLTGKRLLDISRECLRRILLWGYAYRMTGEKAYAARAEQELISISQYSDWNPEHFLDVAEMTTAAAIGYDWLYHYLSHETKESLEKAIVSKGIEPSFNKVYNSWLSKNNNWNQVCNGGITLGALAIYSKIPEKASMLIKRAVNSIRHPMAVYAPEGAYPEGYSYWGYGTTYNLLLIDALTTCLHTDYGLSLQKGFLASGQFIQHMILSDGHSFNYGDCSSSGRINPSVFWIASHTGQTDLLWSEKYLFRHSSPQKIKSYRYSLLALVWGASLSFDKASRPRQDMWVSSQTTVPVAIMRTSWKYKQGMSLAMKGGTAQAGHAHLDAGSFVFVSDDTRWAIDLGPQDYNSLESKGIDLWNKNQDSDRWKVLRYNNLAHNTLSFDGKSQDVYSQARITEYADGNDFKYSIANLEPVYRGQVEKVIRGTALVRSDYALIRDEIKTNAQTVTVRWNMATNAQPTMVDKQTIKLSQNGKSMLIKAESNASIIAKTWTAAPASATDAPNPGVTFVGFEARLTPHSEYVLQVKLIPEGKNINEETIRSLKDWKNYVK